MKEIKINVHILAVLSMMLWGMSYVWTKVVFKYYDPITTVFIRLVLSSVFLIGYIYFFGKYEKLRKEHYKLFLLSALFNPFLYFIGESFGLERVSPTISAVIIAMIPLFTPIAAYIAFKEQFSKVNIVGILLSFFGIIVMIADKNLSLTADPIGVAFLFGAVIVAVIYGILLRKLTQHYSSVTIISYQNIVGAFLFLPLFLIFDLNHFLQVKPNFELVSSLILLAIFASSLAYILYTTTVRKIGISRGNMYTNLIPIFTGITSYLILSEQFTISKISGIFIVILGVILSQLDKLKRNKKQNY